MTTIKSWFLLILEFLLCKICLQFISYELTLSNSSYLRIQIKKGTRKNLVWKLTILNLFKRVWSHLNYLFHVIFNWGPDFVNSILVQNCDSNQDFQEENGHGFIFFFKFFVIIKNCTINAWWSCSRILFGILIRYWLGIL